ncbi:hypothetical protein PVAND_003056 [Polypedilum vanderplanki]|uniref:Osiris 19 n=1 Tax=Polypedilum vanderplanki TaxID=319348 RepID=A0A9J6BTB1_POLVA|nr:hypothetical protein PVAND_003056 [Polypedilum vanderplanki]
MFRSAIVCCFVVLAATAYASPAELRSMCNDENDSFTCMKYKVINYLENVMKNKDNFQLSRNVEVRHNGFAPVYEQRGDKDVFDKVEEYVQSHDVTFNFPSAETKITLSPKQINEGELDLNVKFAGVEARGKSKLKKVMIPILVFVLLKAMTLVPLALGVLGLKAWNALQLSFFSFIISFALAVFQLCKKIAHHGPWDHAARSFTENFFPEPLAEAQDLAYNAYN